MLTQYIQAAMNHATYELLDDQTFYGEIPVCPGVYASARTLEACRVELQAVLEGWMILGLSRNDEFPAIDQITLDAHKTAA